MEIRELWEKAGLLLRQELSPFVFDYLVNSYLTPESLDGDQLVLRVTSDQMKPAVSRNLEVITRAVSQVAGRSMQVLLCTADELQHKDQDAEKAAASGFNPRYTFDRFVVGSNNRFAHAASIAVAEMPGTVYNPLFIYGGSGLGKTHLLHAIGHYVHEHHPDKRLTYITSESFTNDLISAIQQGRNMEFRSRLRNVDILMVDDIQFIAGRDSTQEEFFNTFNDLHSAGKQIILSSDRPPQEIARLEERLRSRFAWGLICDVKPPDLETRIAILRVNAQREQMNVPDEVLELIAVNVSSNIRELEEKLSRLKAYATMNGQPYTEALCRVALHELFDDAHRRAITPELIQRTVSEFYTVSQEDITGPSRRREVAVPRQVAMYLTRELTGLSLPQIGAFYGNRDHSTVMHACAQITSAVAENDLLASQVSDLRQMIKGS